MKERYIATVVLHALGDTIGFRNGIWEFNYNIPITKPPHHGLSELILHDFIDLGGINDINLKDWIVSDDTILHMATINTLLTKYETDKEFINNMKNEFINADLNEKRIPGIMTLKSIKNFDNDISKNIYDGNGGGSGCAIRTLCIGLIYNNINNRKTLIKKSIISGYLTHKSPIGYLGGVVSALFTAFAIENIHVNNWPFELIKILESPLLLDEIINFEMMAVKNDVKIFIDKWKLYVSLKFDKNKNPIIFESHKNPSLRSRFYYEYFTDKKSFIIGSNGYNSCIIAYNSLLDAGKCWEKLVIYSMLHWGDNDSTGCIAAGLYGAVYGFYGVPENNIKHLEFKKKLFKLGEQIYDHYQENI